MFTLGRYFGVVASWHWKDIVDTIKRLQDPPTPEFSTQISTLDFSTPDLSTMNTSSPNPNWVEKFMVEKSGVEKSGVEISRL